MGPTVLVVDDEATICDNVVAFLEDEGMRVHTAQSGESAVGQVAAGLAVQVCIMDLRLPSMTGIEAILDIRRLDPQVRFIIHSGSAHEAVITELRRAGLDATQVFKKPVEDMAQMARAVRSLCAGA